MSSKSILLSRLISEIPKNPITLFRLWFNDALSEHRRINNILKKNQVSDELIHQVASFESVWAMNLATSTKEGIVGNRWVLFKGVTKGTDLEDLPTDTSNISGTSNTSVTSDTSGSILNNDNAFFDCATIEDPDKESGFTFFTHWDSSRKAKDLIDNEGICSIAFYWQFLGRQVRVEGKAHKLSKEENQKYWESRSEASRRGAYVSKQSQEMSISRNEFIEQINSLENVDTCPSHWGGFSIVPHRIEFWENGKDRVHDRIIFERVSISDQKPVWELKRLYP